MRLLTFDRAGVPRVGVRLDDEVVDLGIAAPELPKTMLHLIAAAPEALERARSAAARAGSEDRLAPSQRTYRLPEDRKSAGSGKGVLVRVRLGGRTGMKKK